MRLALRLLADVRPVASKYLEPGAPTGLTGLLTHPSPRSALLYLYGATLDRLSQFPESSVYRQSTEALTKKRQGIVREIKPAGWEEWAARARKKIEANPEAFERVRKVDGIPYIEGSTLQQTDTQDKAWDGEQGTATLEGSRSESEGALNARMLQSSVRQQAVIQSPVDWEPEPPLEAAQIDEMEQKIGAGLIEEVIQVAEGELSLAGTLLESQVWEELEEKPAPGQWSYFERQTHMPKAQEPAE